jgi:hypothetical protein
VRIKTEFSTTVCGHLCPVGHLCSVPGVCLPGLSCRNRLVVTEAATVGPRAPLSVCVLPALSSHFCAAWFQGPRKQHQHSSSCHCSSLGTWTVEFKT